MNTSKRDKLGRPNRGFYFANRARYPGSLPPECETLTKYVKVRVAPDDKEVLRRQAKKEGISVAELVRTYIEWGIETELVELREQKQQGAR